MGWWVTDVLNSQGPVYLFSWVFWVVLSITLHELGHGVAAIWQGDDTPIRRGHMTMNPLVHMGGMSLLAFAVVGIAWGLMPVNPYKFRMGRLGDALVGFAGPLVNLILAFLTLTTYAILAQYVGTQNQFMDNFGTFLSVGGWLNVILFFFNLAPVPPLDGSRILVGISRTAERFYAHPQVQQFGILAFLLLFIFGANFFIAAATHATRWWISLIISILP